MSPDPRRSSGEWPQQHTTPLPGNPQVTFVTTQQFDAFANDCRGFFSRLNDNVDGLREDLAKGSTRFALVERDIKDQKERSDDHSGKIQVLLTDKTSREARAEEKEEHTKPRRDIWFEVIKTVIIAIVLAIAAVIYNAWRDQEVSRVVKELSPPTSTTSAPTTSPPTTTPR